MIPVPQPTREALAKAYHVDPARLMQFGGGREDSDGVVFAYPEGHHARLLKVLAIPAAEAGNGLYRMEERLKFMAYLGQNGARVAFPLPSPAGALYETVQDEQHLWLAYKMDKALGKTPRWETWDPAFFTRWGAALGQLHCLASTYPGWEPTPDTVTGQLRLTWQEEWQSFEKMCPQEDIRQKWVELKARLDALPTSREVYGFTHNDPHIMNLVDDGTYLTILDFDVASRHWYASDIAIACQSTLFSGCGGMDRPIQKRETLLNFLRYFMKGYRTEYVLADEWLDRLDLFIAYRRILLLCVMYGWVSSRPKQLSGWRKMILTDPKVAGNCAKEILI